MVVDNEFASAPAAAAPGPARPVTHEAYEVFERLSSMLSDAYVETDEDVGPRITSFAAAREQIGSLTDQMERLREAADVANHAHVRLAMLSQAEVASPRAFVALPTGIASLTAVAERAGPLAELTGALSAQFGSFITGPLGQLQVRLAGLSNQYKAYCNKTVELRRHQAQLQLALSQRERSALRTLERSLVPAHMGAFEATHEGPLVRLWTGRWWSCYARLDARRRVLLLTTSAKDRVTRGLTSQAHAVALTHYALAHELQESYIQRAAAFELVPTRPELPVIVLASDGSMATRRWVSALQQAIDDAVADGEDGEGGQDSAATAAPHASPEPEAEAVASGEAPNSGEPGGSGAGGGSGALADMMSAMPSALRPLAARLEQVNARSPSAQNLLAVVSLLTPQHSSLRRLTTRV